MSIRSQDSRAALIAAVSILSFSFPASAQVVRGMVRDSAKADPIDAVTVELLGEDEQVVVRSASNLAGEFMVRAPAAGTYRLRLRRVGYATVVVDSILLAAESDTVLSLRLAPSAVTLPPVAVEEAADSRLSRAGFYQRKRGGSGQFLDPPTVDKLASKARVVGDIFDHIPGVRMGLAKDGGVRVPQLRSCRNISSRLTPRTGSSDQQRYPDDPTTDGLSLMPRIYLDGMSVEKGIFASLLPTDILAVEIYMGPSQIPLQYGGTDAPCGVILIWTRQ